MIDFLIFGGTGEGRVVAHLLQHLERPTHVCVATEYGESLLKAGGTLTVQVGRLDEATMVALIKQKQPRLVLDATHPYADIVSTNIQTACCRANTQYIRILRQESSQEDYLAFDTLGELTTWLNTTTGVIFSSLGAKEAVALTAVDDFTSRFWLRILPFATGIAACLDAGFMAKQLICMQGPFGQELNEAMFRQTHAQILITKESGNAGGFAQKLAAAKACGMTVAVLRRPSTETGLTLTQVVQQIKEGKL